VIVMVALLAATALPSAAQQSGSPALTPALQVYQCPADKLDATVARLRLEFQTGPDVRFAADARTSQILVYAPPEVQAQIAQRVAAVAQGPALEANPSRPAAASPPASPADSRATKSFTVGLRNTTARQFEEAIVAALGKRLVSLPAAELGVRSYQLVLPGGGTVRLDLRQQTNQATVQGPAAGVESCVRLIQALDTAESTADRSTRLVPLQRGSIPSVRKAVEAIQTSTGAKPHGPLVTMLFQQQGEAEQPAAPPGQAPAQAPAQPPAAAPEGQPAEKGGGLIGSVQVELMQDLDIIIIRGHRRDVDQVQEIINEIERLSATTAPAIELYYLKHVDSGAMAELVVPIYEDVFSMRQGYVSITSLVKPNALLFIGRKESVETAIDLVKRLDEPVPPETQFRVFRLQHAPALTVQQTVLEFYTLRFGLGPRIRATADFRSNVLIVQASPRDLEEIAELIAKIDTPTSAAVNELRVFELKNTLADDLAPVLQMAISGQQTMQRAGVPGVPGAFGAAGVPGMAGLAGAAAGGLAAQKSTALQFVTVDPKGRRVVSSGILTDVRVMSDPRSNTLLVSAPTQCMELIEALIKQLDELPAVEAKIKVFTISNADATTLMIMLQQLFTRQVAGQAGMPPMITQGQSLLVPLRLSVDVRTNSIIAIGSVGDLQVAEALLVTLDDSDIRHRKTMVYTLKNIWALDAANVINSFLSMERQVQLTSPGVSAFEEMQREVVVVGEPVTNNLIISATPRFFEEVMKIVEHLDERPPMVMIQVLIAEITLDNTDEFGVELGLQDGILFDRSLVSNVITSPAPGFPFNTSSLGNFNNPVGKANLVGTQGLSNFSVGRSNGGLGFGGLVLSASSENVSVLLRALSECHRLEVLSRPQIMTLNNQQAYIQVGQTVPYITGVTTTTFGQTNSVSFQSVGLQVLVTPRISPDGMVVMQIDAIKSQVGPEAEGIPVSISATGQVVRSPRIDITQALTTIAASNGQTMILGGLITRQKTEFHRKVPWLGDVPVLGRAFRADGTFSEKKELLIIMTPHIVKGEGDGEKIRQIETARIHWCLGDVLAMNGGGELRSRGDAWSDAETTVIYPDETPGGPSGAVEPIPTPSGTPGNRETKQGPNSTPPYPPSPRPRLEEPPAEPTSRAPGASILGLWPKRGGAPAQPHQATQASQQWPPQPAAVQPGAAQPGAAQPAIYQSASQPPAAAPAVGFGGPGPIVPSSFSAPQQAALQKQQLPLPYQQPAGIPPADYWQYPQQPQFPLGQTPSPQTTLYR
jgi:type II secretion system protein D